MSINFMSVGEALDEMRLSLTSKIEPEVRIYAMVGRFSKKLFGIVIKSADTKREIYFHDIDRMVQILESMKGRG